MLLQHAWLAPLVKPETITEEDEEAAEAANEPASGGATTGDAPIPVEAVVDQEVADWVRDALEKRRQGRLGKGAQKPALHAAPLDAVSSPNPNGVNGLDAPPATESAETS
jgi:mitogen-activated protein kinase kinase